jgi:uncharacterized protein (TIGR02996 family)
MSAFPSNPSLEAAVIADAEDDAPRLVYADWLDDHGDPDRAEFIRVQCRLAALSPAEPGWVDLTERQGELAARLKNRFLDLEPAVPKDFYFGNDFLGAHEEPFRRGFPYFISRNREDRNCTPEALAQLLASLPELVEKTTVRGLDLHPIAPRGLTDLFATPAFDHFTGLSVFPHSTTDSYEDTGRSEWDAVYRTIATNPAAGHIRHLCLYGYTHSVEVAALARSQTLSAVRRMTIQGLSATPADTTALVEAPWFGRLHHFRSHLSSTPVARRMMTGLGALPGLHTLELPDFKPAAVPALAKGRFPALGRLDLVCPIDQGAARALARGKFPRLAVLNAPRCGMRNDAFSALVRADWFSRLRVLNLDTNDLGDKAITALAASPAAQMLRILRLGNNSFGKSALGALARQGAFPELTTLDLGSSLKRKATEADLVAFLSTLAQPGLRYLSLEGWPLGDAGAKALAGSSSLAGLTRLDLSSCAIGDPGARALLASPQLQHLVELRLNDNKIKNGVDELCDPAVMPRLVECWLNSNKIPRAAGEKLRASGRYVLV